MHQVISLLKFIIDDSPGDILILCEHGAHRSVGLALLLLFCLGYDDVSHTAEMLERTRYVIDCSTDIRNYTPQTVRVLGMQDELRKWMGDIFPQWGNRRKVIEGLVSAKEFERIAKDEVPKALAAQAEQAAKGTASPRATSQSAASDDPPIKRTSDVTVPLEADDKKKRVPRQQLAMQDQRAGCQPGEQRRRRPTILLSSPNPSGASRHAARLSHHQADSRRRFHHQRQTTTQKKQQKTGPLAVLWKHTPNC